MEMELQARGSSVKLIRQWQSGKRIQITESQASFASSVIASSKINKSTIKPENSIASVVFPETRRRSRKASQIQIDRKDVFGGVDRKFQLQVRQANVIGDPVHPRTLAEKKIRNVLLYWSNMLVLLAALNAVTLFAFRIIPTLYATKELRKIFLTPMYGFCSIVGFEVAIFIHCFYSYYVLAFPDESHWKIIGNKRWFPFPVFHIYIVTCIVWYIRESRGIVRHIQAEMTADLSPSTAHSKTLLKTVTQSYYHCCGLKSYRDWAPYLGPEGNYPSGCYNVDTNPAYIPPPFNSSIGIYEEGCVESEATLAVAVAGIFIFLSTLFGLSAISVTIGMKVILTYVWRRDIELEQASPFYA